MAQGITKGAGDRLLAHRQPIIEQDGKRVRHRRMELGSFMLGQKRSSFRKAISKIELGKLFEQLQGEAKMRLRQTYPSDRPVLIAVRCDFPCRGAADDRHGTAVFGHGSGDFGNMKLW